MTIYENNITFLQNEIPSLYNDYIMKRGDTEGISSPKKVEVVTSNSFKNLLLNNKLVHSKYDPYMDGQFISMSLQDQDFDTIFIFGIGFGYHLEEIFEQYPDKNKIIYEPNIEIFENFINNFELKKLYKKNVMIMLSDKKENVIKNITDTFMVYKIYKINFTGLATYITEYFDDWAFITKEYVDFFGRYTVNVKTLRVYSEAWILNFFNNLRSYPYESDINDYVGKFKDIPGIIVSSGPSLTKNMHLLNNIADNAIILSAGSSINALQSKNIKPHIMLGVDGSQLMSDEYNAVKDNTILFSHIMNIHPDCIEKYKGPKMHIKVSSEPHIDYMEKITGVKTTQLRTGGSCANVAMDFLYQLGCNPIILIGQDLAFPGNVTHAEGVWDRKNISNEIEQTGKRDYFITKDINGDEIYTNRIFHSFRKWFEEYIEEKDKEGIAIAVINATEGGAFIKGAQHLSFSETIDKYCKENKSIQQKLDEIFFESTKNSLKNKEDIDKFLNVWEKEINKIEKWSNQRLKYVERKIKLIESKKTDSANLKEKINNITNKMEKNEAYYFLIWQSLHDLLYNVKNNYEAKANEVETTAEKLKLLYEGLKNQFEYVHFRVVLIRKCIEETKEVLKGVDNDANRV